MTGRLSHVLEDSQFLSKENIYHLSKTLAPCYEQMSNISFQDYIL